MTNLLIQGGEVIDGTGKPAFKADVRVRGQKIVEVAPNLRPSGDERVFGAKGCYVSPGFIEAHTHFDGTMWWQPDMDPLPGYGVTTAIIGNCGFTAAPVPTDPKVREEIIGIFSFFEDIPREPFKQLLPWDWSKWSEYKKSMTANLKTAANFGAFVGHIPIRLTVMGMDAWTRAARPDEIKSMCALLDDALAAGALGMSTNLMDHDGDGRKIVTLHADEAEWTALFDVLERYPQTSLQVLVDTSIHLTAPKMIPWIVGLMGDRKIRVQLAGGVPTLQYQTDIVPPLLALHESFKRDKKDIWAGYAHIPTTVVINVNISLVFAQSDEFVWHEVVQAKTVEEKTKLLRDPSWRARARESWDSKAHKHSPFADGRRLIFLDSENGVGPLKLTASDYGKILGLHPSDAMAEWLLRNGLNSTVHMAPFEMIDEMVVKLLKDPMSVGNISDAPAHGQMFCGGGENMLLFTTWVKDKKAITVEEAVYVQTGKLAKHFNLADIGEIKEGKRADITVFKLDEIARREMEKINDVPDGKGGTIWRWTRKPAPMRLTLCNGEPTFENGAFTGKLPGALLSPAQ